MTSSSRTPFRRVSFALGALTCLCVLVFRPSWSGPLALNLLGLAGVAILGIFFVRLATRSPTPGRAMHSLAAFMRFALVLGLLEGVGAAVLAFSLERSDERLRQVYGYVFRGGQLGRRLMGTAAFYEEHHYLPFVLNPEATYGDKRQFNGYYHIRRGEPIRPRSEVKWRALAIGGSTTFGERLEREEDTWVHRLEDLVRAHGGPDRDVVNGGVSGYTLNENIIHYMMLLTHLDPDVVILYVGINDVHPRWHTPETMPDYSNFWKPWHGAGTVLPEPDRSLAWSNLYRTWFFLERIRPLSLEGVVKLSARDSVGSLTQNLERSTPWVYASHLDSFIRLLLAQGRRVLVVPQYFRIAHDTAAADRIFKKGVEDDNDVNRETALRRGVPFAGQILSALGPEDTGDDCHFTPQGSAKFAALVYDALEKNGLLR